MKINPNIEIVSILKAASLDPCRNNWLGSRPKPTGIALIETGRI